MPASENPAAPADATPDRADAIARAKTRHPSTVRPPGAANRSLDLETLLARAAEAAVQRGADDRRARVAAGSASSR